MRPIRLTLQAFGPYAGREVVDFQAALDAGVFGIYGPTGAGKTSIFDGISFVLFGVSSGDERAAEDMLSHYADPAVLTFAELVFDLGPKRYVVRRIPNQQRSASRGKGLAVQHHEAYLFDATGLSVDELRDDFSGDVVAEKKVSVVDQQIKELLGYDAAQFRQIVLLPQGEFRKILTANSDDRSVILKRLFDVSSYERFLYRAKEKASQKRREIQDQRLLRDSKLLEVGCETEAEFVAQIDARELSVQSLANDVAELIKTAAVAQKALLEAQILADRFAAFETLRGDLQKLGERDADIAALKGRVKQAKLAQIILSAESVMAQAKTQLRDVQSRHKQGQVQLEQALAYHGKATQMLETLETRQAESEALDVRVQELARWQGILQKSQHLQDAARRADQDAQQAHRAMLQAEKQQKSNQEAMNALRSLQAALPAHMQALSEAEKEKTALEVDLKAAMAFEKAQASFAEVNHQVETLKARHAEAKAHLSAMQAVFSEAEQELSDMQVLHIGKKLQPGHACPVCGSLDHPSPVTGDAARMGRHDRFADAEQDVLQAKEREQEAANRLNAGMTRLEERLSMLEALTAPEQSVEHLQQHLPQVKARHLELSKDARFANLDARLGQAEREGQATDKALNDAKMRLSDCEKALSAAQSAFTARRDEIPAEWHDHGRLDKALSQAKAEQERLKTEWTKAVEGEKQAALSLATARQAVSGLQADRERLQSAYEEHQTQFEAKLTSIGMDEAGYLMAKPDIDQLAGFELAISDHETAIASRTAQKDRLLVEIGELANPDLAVLRSVQAESEQKLITAREDLTRQQTELVQHQDRLKAWRVMQDKISGLEEAYKPLGEIANLVDGINDVKIRLPDFAVAAMLDEVLSAANLRLGPMTAGRYQLHRPEERTGGRGKRGLDIVVFDGNTQMSRPTKSLSGGEGFQASLALALGLSDVVEQTSGGIKLDAIFIDEGFGSLDEETLDTALDSLCSLSGEKRAVGLISHTEQVKTLITAGFDIEKTPNGSHIRPRDLV